MVSKTQYKSVARCLRSSFSTESKRLLPPGGAMSFTTKDEQPQPAPPRRRTTTRQRETIRSKFGKSVVVSTQAHKAYDLDGDGKLDAVEQIMMTYDADGDGAFSNAEIYQIIKEQLLAERRAGRMKRAVIGLSCFVFVLALSNLGTSFAAMFLSKELAADTDESVMRLQSNGHLASVQTTGETYDITPLTQEEYMARRLLVLAEIEADPHSNSHRRLKKVKNKLCGDDSLDCDGDIQFDNGRIKERDFTVIETKCKQQRNVKIRRASEFDKKADAICSSGTSVVVKTKKKKKDLTNIVVEKGKTKVTRDRDREVIIVAPDKRKMTVDCVGEDCYVSGDILLGRYGDSCDRNRDECEAHLICEASSAQGRSSQYGTCIYPRFAKIIDGGVCDLSYGEEACESGYYCYSDKGQGTQRGVRGGGSDIILQGSSGTIAVDDSSNARLATRLAGVGMCRPRVGVGSSCASLFACIDGYRCIGAGGMEVGGGPAGGGVVSGPSGVVTWGAEVDSGICM
ncbi:hypothetical protein HJC23_006646 [Cyclotella cryptica]|uniref:EF-hand domain-containing protein n=1 Tax=Cyclotella cryptica TaxID=29204 RepID=A0ABD3QX95_9STRA